MQAYSLSGEHQTQRTLAEQMRITDADIKERKNLLGLTEGCEQKLAAIEQVAREIVDDVVDEFYDHQIEIPKIRSIIGDSDTLLRLRNAMRGYVLNLFCGKYGRDYVNSRLRIGKVHARIGVPPKLYVSSLHGLEKILCTHLNRRLDNKAPTEALHKLMLFDLQFVFDTYIQGLVAEVEVARDEMINYSHMLEQTVAQRTAQIQRLAHTDELTGLWNRRSLYTEAEKLIAQAENTGTCLSVAFMDIDGFKQINDSEGHQCGDRILADVGQFIHHHCRGSDAAFRYGGDEFCLLMPDTSAQAARHLCDQIEDGLRSKTQGHVRLSCGISTYQPGDMTNPDTLISEADSNMYVAKQENRKDERTPVQAGRRQQDDAQADQKGRQSA